MPFVQHGNNAKADIKTYNDVAGNQNNNNTTDNSVRTNSGNTTTTNNTNSNNNSSVKQTMTGNGRQRVVRR
ncbi:hypothetical protein SERLA73DRAFT_178639 [Serpula lacrymans var. lacrymans S7.3]|uniref:Uncharacterized protein n=2 Tax=Serpula lacrymans var. lacrymans TaxID=341189 RepID=F8PSB6_SERL3|nr:uncharacterized protein SERLADRAFT_463159 [Serpula lacrymans var. lacrymans S7.9]EGO00729.1 hypothetical protein SERLA73DRAFT_178639 [Serpula lacrymans var. lacrymans S7.3]EGO26274.1 hypothetical protein SERLADRAFT_463159 [Serpula lacrymans var. lacrymans S7.9]